jgi:hypothetical protein
MGRLSLSLRSLTPNPDQDRDRMPVPAGEEKEEGLKLASEDKRTAPLNPWDLKSHTWDVQVSPLLIKPARRKASGHSVTVMRGGDSQTLKFGDGQ